MQPVAYPKRPPFFANRFCRLMMQECLANQIGPEACFLLMVVAHAEDAKRYRGAVTYWNEQLVPLVGLNNVKALARVRERAVEAGWLNYQPGGKGRPGVYWVVVPDQYEGTDDAPAEENPSEYHPTLLDKIDPQCGQQNGREAGEKRERSGIAGQNRPTMWATKREESGQHSSSVLSPTPHPYPPAAGGVVSIESLTELLAEWETAKLPGHDTPGGIRPTPTRRGLWQQRLSDPRWAAEWREAVRRLGRSEKARGLSAGFARGVRLDDLLTKPDYLTRIMEGEFDDGPATSRTQPPERVYDVV